MTDLTNSPNLEPTASSPLPSEPSVLRKVFFGPDGLRAGWSLILFVLFLGLVFSGLSLVIRHFHLLPAGGPGPGQELGPGFTVIAEAIPFLGVLLITWILSKIEGRPNSVYGLGGPRPVFRFFTGVFWGAVCLSLLVFVLRLSGLLVFDGRLLFGMAVLHYGFIWFLGFLMVGFLEEYLTRGFLLFTLARGIGGIYAWLFKSPHSKAAGFWTAALLLSVLFGLGHRNNTGESPIGLLSAGLVGLVFCLSLWRSGSLWWAIGFHAAWDWAQSYLYGVADSGLMVQHHLFATHPVGKALLSGGTTGPEGSLLILAILVLICLIILFTIPRSGYPAYPQAWLDTRPGPDAIPRA